MVVSQQIVLWLSYCYFLSIIKSGIARTERNAKFIRKYIQQLCMVINLEKVRSKHRDRNFSVESMVNANCELLALNLTLLVCVQYLHLHDMSSLNVLSQRIQYLNKLNKLLGTLALHGCKTSATVKTTNGE